MGAYVDDCVTIWFSVDTGFDYASKTVTIESRFTPSLNCFGGSVESIKSLTGFGDGVEVLTKDIFRQTSRVTSEGRSVQIVHD